MAGTEILGQAVETAKGDLLTIEGEVFRQIEDPNDPKRKILVPVKVEAHVNPLSLALGAGAVGLMGLAATVIWNGLSLPTPLGEITFLKGLKDSDFWKNEASRARAALTIRRLRKGAASGEGTIPDPDLFDSDPCVRSEAIFRAETNAIFRTAMKAKAKKQGCAWAQ